MTSEQKDRICNGIDTQMMIEKFQQQEQSKSTNLTLEQQTISDSNGNNQNDDNWKSVQTRRNINNKKKIIGNNIIDHSIQSKVLSKSSPIHYPSNQNQISSYSHSNQHQTNKSVNRLSITNYALDYASNYHFPPIKLECYPKITERKEGTRLINDLIKTITPGFLTQNPCFSNDIFVDLWWINPEGNIQLIIKSTDLYVYLCKKDRYPNQINNVKINPIPPNHLPPQHTVIIKWVNNSFIDDDIRDELNMKFESIFLIESMHGTMNEKNRHMKVEILEKKEYIKILNSGKINLGGQLYSVDEYLPSPRILICNRCNLPGHTKKSCRNSDVDICRRCGKPRTNIKEQMDCEIKCHHCQEKHLANDYKCKIIDKYRRELIDELKKHPERMPAEVQLFIPTEYRSDDRKKMIYNEKAYQQYQCIQQQQHYNKIDEIGWPLLKTNNSSTSTSAVSTDICMAIKNLSEELKEEKKRFEIAQKQIEDKYKNIVQSTNQVLLLVKQVQQTQETTISTMSKVLNQVLVPVCSKSLENLELVITKLKTRVRNIELDDVIELINNQISYINEAYKEFDRHQEELKMISDKQNETMATAMDNMLQLING
ncbi:unnamed protein product [Rotaria sp. Silwood1]|nr:unnamed protein product [Rotaria sp. Silwood1]CAF1619279.1 unnamed protein product [Rotaria sp. Silwood1]CAF3724785.1 unnamed protein product [Rotaria sp. Silwood1]CAF3757998.1 unnamed protein product [Rotaria sp. Silwood1]CAF3761164.1 unnamed protein product [Rotaria sp. Silwood1]